MSDIQTLSDRIDVLSTNVDWWNNFLIWALVATALAAIAVLVGTRMVVIKTKALADAQDEFGKAKEAQLRTELHDKDLKIEETRKETVELEAVVAGRQLSTDQRTALTATMKQFAGKNIFISSYSGDAEAARIGIQIKNALLKSGIHVEDQLGRTVATGGGVAFGINVTGPSSEKDMGATLAHFLQTHGIQSKSFEVQPQMRINEAVTGIMVALKPIEEK